MNILISCVQFKKGGLETFIHSLLQGLIKVNDLNIYLLSSFFDNDNPILKSDNINLITVGEQYFYESSSVASFEKIYSILKTNSIKLVVHNGVSGSYLLSETCRMLDAEFFQITHGPFNLSPLEKNNRLSIYNTKALLDCSTVYAVSQEVNEAFYKFNSSIKVFPINQPLEIETEKKSNDNNTKFSYILSSRFEEYSKSQSKVTSIIQSLSYLNSFFDKFPECSGKVYIAGEGNGKGRIVSYLNEMTHIRAQTEFIGWVTDYKPYICEKTIALGMGRFLLEMAVFSNVLPILTGYNRVIGILCVENYTEYKYSNFSGRNISPDNTNKIQVDTRNFLLNDNNDQKLSDLINSQHNNTLVAKQILERYQEIASSYRKSWGTIMFETIKKNSENTLNELQKWNKKMEARNVTLASDLKNANQAINALKKWTHKMEARNDTLASDLKNANQAINALKKWTHKMEARNIALSTKANAMITELQLINNSAFLRLYLKTRQWVKK